MLIPRKPPKGFRKPHHPRRTGASKGGTRVVFGDWGIQALEPAYVTNRQIEAARIAMNRHIRRGGKVWITVFPDNALTKKPAETRMGSGKGFARVVGGQHPPGTHSLRDGVPERGSRSRGHASRDPQASDEVPHRQARSR